MENPKNKIWQYLLGKPSLDVDSVDLSGVDTNSPEFKENAPAVDIKVGNNPRVGGLLPDIAAGYRENSSRPMEFSNLQANITPDGREKGGAYRFGEFAGTAARLLDNPLVRGAITYGLSKNMGDKNPLNEALAATVGTQQNKMKDTMYRQALAERGIDTSGIRGWLGDDTFKYLLEDQQVRDNAAYRNAYLESQRTNQAIANQIALDKLNYTKLQDAQQNAIANRRLNIEEKKLNNKMTNLSSKDLSAYRDKLATLKDINAGLDLIEKNPKAYSLLKGSLPAWATNRIDPEGITTRTQIDNITAVYRKWLTGAQMSDAERKAYERFLPAPTDNYETIKAKLQGMRDSIERKNNILVDGANEYQNMAQTTQNEGWAF